MMTLLLFVCCLKFYLTETRVDVQLSGSGADSTISAIRSLIPTDRNVSDKRLTNSEAQSSYYTGAVFIYEFLFIIALITAPAIQSFSVCEVGVNSDIGEKIYVQESLKKSNYV